MIADMIDWPSRDQWQSEPFRWDWAWDPPAKASLYATAGEIEAIVAALKAERRTLRHPDPDVKQHRKHRLFEAVKALEKTDKIPLALYQGGDSPALAEIQSRYHAATEAARAAAEAEHWQIRHSEEGWQRELARRARVEAWHSNHVIEANNATPRS
jgi:hypothetical protein